MQPPDLPLTLEPVQPVTIALDSPLVRPFVLLVAIAQLDQSKQLSVQVELIRHPLARLPAPPVQLVIIVQREQLLRSHALWVIIASLELPELMSPAVHQVPTSSPLVLMKRQTVSIVQLTSSVNFMELLKMMALVMETLKMVILILILVTSTQFLSLTTVANSVLSDPLAPLVLLLIVQLESIVTLMGWLLMLETVSRVIIARLEPLPELHKTSLQRTEMFVPPDTTVKLEQILQSRALLELRTKELVLPKKMTAQSAHRDTSVTTQLPLITLQTHALLVTIVLQEPIQQLHPQSVLLVTNAWLDLWNKFSVPLATSKDQPNNLLAHSAQLVTIAHGTLELQLQPLLRLPVQQVTTAIQLV